MDLFINFIKVINFEIFVVLNSLIISFGLDFIGLKVLFITAYFIEHSINYLFIKV